MVAGLNLPLSALQDALPALGRVSFPGDPSPSLEGLLDAVRDEMARSVRLVPHERLHRPEFDPVTGLPKDDGVDRVETRDFDKAEVKAFDRARRTYWTSVRAEVHELVCTKSERYADLRKRLDSVGEKGDKAIVALVAAAIGSTLGVAAGAIGGLVAVALFAVVKIGVNAYCAMVAGPQAKPSGEA